MATILDILVWNKDLFIDAAIGMVILVEIAFLVIFLLQMRPVLPYLIASWKQVSMVIMLRRDNALKFLPARYSSGIFNTYDGFLSFIHMLPTSYRFGKTSAAFAVDNCGQTVDSRMTTALKVLSDNGIKNRDLLDAALEKSAITGSTYIKIPGFREVSIHNLSDYIGGFTPSDVRRHLTESLADVTEEYRRSYLGDGMNPETTKIIVLGIILVIVIAVGTKMSGMW